MNMEIRTDILNRKEDIIRWVSENKSKAFMCREFGCKPETLDSYLSKMGIIYKGNKGGKGIKIDPKRKTAEEYAKSNYPKSDTLKKKMISDGIRDAKCECCGLIDWLDNPIALELHHIDGNRFNNVFENLQILCPNCHSQTNNYGSKNRK
jgi:hypothetical protein